jgi:membrane protease YdiL (CAAX protease family)
MQKKALLKILQSPGSWVAQRGPSRPLPQLPISWGFFIIVTSALMIVGQVLINILPYPGSRLVVSAIIELLILRGALYWRGMNFKAIGLSLEQGSTELKIGLGISLAWVAVFSLNNTLAGSPPALEWLIYLARDPSVQRLRDTLIWLLRTAADALAVGIVEEVIHRGWILTFLIISLRSYERALWLSALVFGVPHYYLGLKGIIVTAAFGYICGLLYLWRKNLVVPIILHTLWDFALWIGVLGKLG